jgi:endonuclease YncB( thermonuclease family)
MARRGKTMSTGALVLALLIGAVLWWIDNHDKVTKELGEYTEYSGCTLASHRNNDGDSFHVNVPGGKTQEFRLYFVDAPESAYKTYGGGDNNGERLRYQAEYFGLESRDKTTGLGMMAKKWTADVLGRGAFTVHTRGERVYQGPRQYCFVKVRTDGGDRWLHELLVEQGLARIYTQGATLPDGTKRGTQEARLLKLESEAKKAKRGGWGM